MFLPEKTNETWKRSLSATVVSLTVALNSCANRKTGRKNIIANIFLMITSPFQF